VERWEREPPDQRAYNALLGGSGRRSARMHAQGKHGTTVPTPDLVTKSPLARGQAGVAFAGTDGNRRKRHRASEGEEERRHDTERNNTGYTLEEGYAHQAAALWDSSREVREEEAAAHWSARAEGNMASHWGVRAGGGWRQRSGQERAAGKKGMAPVLWSERTGRESSAEWMMKSSGLQRCDAAPRCPRPAARGATP
jgi:hypothetical protein